ncbi:hypothetical protein SLEP1_g55422 [Rubroshorea leprosula]|uniref:Uncharacterized protein n=1 Tax=Rubroshorea leprosula TaxID=152421 RepID=A0AAV5MHV6_9ROSI|nr:hypothetical protein SLEP1_g55422 [Rubroshorea leprosula]
MKIDGKPRWSKIGPHQHPISFQSASTHQVLTGNGGSNGWMMSFSLKGVFCG